MGFRVQMLIARDEGLGLAPNGNRGFGTFACVI